MKYTVSDFYTIKLTPGNHGIWLFVMKGEQVIFEQSGYENVSIATKVAGEIIEYNEMHLGGPFLHVYNKDDGN